MPQKQSKHRSKVAAIILAAGKSSRLRRPKQLLPFRGSTLIRHVAQVALFSQADFVIAVLGAFQLRIRKEIQFLDIDVVRNIFWFRGLGASIKAGIHAAIERDPDIQGFLLMQCDQPLISEDYLDSMIAQFAHSKIIASGYGGSFGVPSLIHRDYANELLALDDSACAKEFLDRHKDEVNVLEFDAGELDVDTPSDLIKLFALTGSNG
jgi:molybdenum cofactor cytidylyltransferase